jgi:hypothetical protein
MSSHSINQAVETADALIREKLKLEVELVDSAFWHKEQFQRCGDWSSWVWETVTGRDYDTRRPHFAGFIICEEELGKANAQLVELALRNGRSVLFARRNRPLSTVKAVEEADSTNWQRGWKAIIEGEIQ